jgi:hypothetical protein
MNTLSIALVAATNILKDLLNGSSFVIIGITKLKLVIK